MPFLPSRRESTDLSQVGSYMRPPARVERAVHHAVAIEEGRGLVQASRVRAAEYVAFTALSAVENLTNFEALAIARNPLGEGRYRAIVDTATASMARIVAETGRSR